ncbi:MAG: MarR family winged helix-turn-helix transcriptional regulator [Armatimonadaceae bacterium]
MKNPNEYPGEAPSGAVSLAEPQRRAWKALFIAHPLLMEAVEKALVEAGVGNKAEYDVLYTLETAEGGRLRLNELAEAVVLSPSGLSRRVDQIERRGWVRREGSEEDKRSFYAVLTDSGREALDRIWDVYAETVAAHFGQHLSDDEAEVLRRAFTRMVLALRPQQAIFHKL